MLKTTPLGANSGLIVSRLCLGTMNFGEPGRGHQGDWTLGLDDARPLFKAAIEKGLFYFDCADIYGIGASEMVVGALLRELLPRDEYVLASKISMPMGKNPNQGGLSRKHVMEGVDACLKRLGVDYLDKLVIHRHPHGIAGHETTPIEETLEALHDVVKAGKVTYLGASSMFAWQFAELQLTAKLNGWTPFVSMQNHYNLVYREEERDAALLRKERRGGDAMVAPGAGHFGRGLSGWIFGRLDGAQPGPRPDPHRGPLSRRGGVRHCRQGD